MTRNTLSKIGGALAALVCLSAHSAELKLTPSEIEQAHLYLDQTRNGVIGATKGLSEAQWKFKPAADRWSVAEIVEHMVVVQELVLGPIREQLAKSPVVIADRDYKQIDAVIVNQLPDRLQKFQAPEMLRPSGRWEPSVALDRLVKDYARLSDYLDSTPDLRQHVTDAPPLKAVSKGAYDSMDGYQWVLGAAAHTERHTKQILEVKADPNFPAK